MFEFPWPNIPGGDHRMSFFPTHSATLFITCLVFQYTKSGDHLEQLSNCDPLLCRRAEATPRLFHWPDEDQALAGAD